MTKNWRVEESSTSIGTTWDDNRTVLIYLIKNNVLAIQFDTHNKAHAHLVCRMLNKAEDEVCDGIAVRQEIALLLGLTPPDKGDTDRSLGDISAWYALPNIRAEITRLTEMTLKKENDAFRRQIAELNKQIEEAQIACAQDQQRLFHYERVIAEHDLTVPALDTYPEEEGNKEKEFEAGDRVWYRCGSVGWIPAVVRGVRPKRIIIYDEKYKLVRGVKRTSLSRTDPTLGG
jgi:hypothetical protein